ncbi:MAG: hypothetical protein IKR48_11080, partial [Kiritimatiellae bacterium]|nr:hypothetical protein [Kiritimatiellia bacterium]
RPRCLTSFGMKNDAPPKAAMTNEWEGQRPRCPKWGGTQFIVSDCVMTTPSSAESTGFAMAWLQNALKGRHLYRRG